ncbi:transcriptional regulator [Sphingomonas hengshuiensis]|uniref:Cytoplasmic chaperone TorD n=1 Tax=Sphingomonas hengshuiensis TaxID=1609977 RepID=A0A7U4J9Z3_9SPHN|nr:YdaS family helix-turn-helix protein [Sphingomonas hengshuiensis]AJP72949.1 hypothetical protein TS85_15840 [Sphingomonas hengshuiensis]
MAVEHHSDSSLARAVRVAGSQSKYARLIGVAQQTVHDWLKKKRPLPAEHVLKTEAETGVSRHDLRPDLYPRESATDHAGELDR